MPFVAGMPKSPTFRLHPITALIQATLLGLPATALAGPEGGVVAAGTGTIARPDAQTTHIHQSSQHLILNWDSYNIRANETVNYRQPNANAQALNRILGQNPSHIYGRLNANGQVLLVNPNGVFFKPGARVNVGGLIASGLNITDKDFLAGKYRFKHTGDTAPGAVINQGVIQAATGGSVSLIGGAVKNAGRILAHAGQVNLVAGRALAMDFDGDGLMRFTVSEALLKKTEGLSHAVSNTGTIAGGAVLLQGRAARSVFSEVVNNSGVIGAAKVDNTGGVIRLVAGGSAGSPTGGNSLINTGTLRAAGGTIKLKAEGKAEVSGEAHISTASKTGKGGQIDIAGQEVRIAGGARLDASSAAPAVKTGGAIKLKAQNKAIVTGKARLSATSKAGKGGQIEITGEKVGLMGLASLDVSGATGGGQILAGGGYQGKNPAIKNAKVTYIGKSAKLAADATQNGKGGRVIVWADDTTRYHGAISAKGGRAGGDGGFVEVSGKRHLAFRGKVDVSARKGRAGTLLLDPRDLCIGGNTSCTTGGNMATEKTANPFTTASGHSFITQESLTRLVRSQPNISLIFQADRDIFFDGNIALPGLHGSGEFRLIAGRNIDMKGNSLSLSGEGASARFYAGGNITLGNVSVPNGSIHLSANGRVTQSTGVLTAINLYLNQGRPATTSAGTLIAGLSTAQAHSGTYLLTNNNVINSLNLGGALGGNLSFKDNGAGFTLAGAVDIGTHRITLDSAGNITQNTDAVISGTTGGLTKAGTGKLTLKAENDYMGQTNVTGGTLELDGARPSTPTGVVNVLPSSAVDLAANTTLVVKRDQTIGGLSSSATSSKVQIQKGFTLTIDNSADHTFKGVISETTDSGVSSPANLAKRGTGQLTLTNTNTYTGTTTISGGRLRIEHTGALGPASGGAVIVQNNASLILALPNGTGGTTFAKNLSLAGAGAADPADSSARLGALRLVSGGATRTTLSGTITLTGAATIISARNQTLQINANPRLQGAGDSGAAHNLTLGGAGDIDLGARGDSGKGLITGSGELIKTGAGTLRLNRDRGTGDSAGNHTGTIRVQGGTLQLNATNAISTASKLVVKGGVFDMQGHDARFSEVVELAGGEIKSNNTTVKLTLNNATGGTADADNARFFQLKSGKITNVRLAGTAGLEKTTPGTVTLTHTDTGTVNRMTYGGAVHVRGGVLKVEKRRLLKASGDIHLYPGGTLNLLTNSFSPRLFGTADNSRLGSAILYLRGGALKITHTGTTFAIDNRNLRLRGNSTIEIVIQGRENLECLHATTCILNTTLSGDLALQSADGATGYNLTIKTTRAGTFKGTYSASAASNVIISGNLTGKGGLIKTGTGGKLTLSGANTYTGETEVKAGELELARAGGDTISDSAGVKLANVASAKLTVKDDETLKSLTGGGDEGGNVKIASGKRLSLASGNYAGVISGGSAGTSGTLTKTGSGTLTLRGANTYTGTTLVNAGVLEVRNNNALGATGAGNDTTVAADATLRLQGSGLDVGEALTLQGHLTDTTRGGTLANAGGDNEYSGALTLPGTGYILSAASTTLTLSGGVTLNGSEGGGLIAGGKGDITITGKITSSGGAYVIKGRVTRLGGANDTGILTLSNNANDYTGQTHIQNGTLRITAAGALGATGTAGRTVLSGGGILELQAANESNSLDIGEPLYIAGAGTLRNLRGVNTWRGPIRFTQENGSSLTVDNQQAPAASAPTLTLSGGIRRFDARLTNFSVPLTFTGAGYTLVSGALNTGTGSLTKKGAGKLRLSGANLYTGDTEVEEGELELAHSGGNAIDDSSAVKLSSTASANAKLTITNSETIGSLAGGGEVAIANGQTLTVKNAGRTNTTYSGLISGAGNLAKGAASTDTGRLTLTGANTYTGTTTVNYGTLAVGDAGALNSDGDGGAVTVNSGGVLALQGGITLNRAITLAGGALGNISGNNRYTGALSLSGPAGYRIQSTSGTLTVSIALNLGASGAARNLTVTGAGGVALTGVISGAGGIIKGEAAGDTGKLTLKGTANNTFAGAVRVNHGVLRIEHAGALGTPASGNTQTTVASGGTLALAGGITVPNTEELNLAGAGARPAGARQGALRNASGANEWQGAIRLTGDATIHNDQATANTLTLSGRISRASGLTAEATTHLTITGGGNTLISSIIATGAHKLTKKGAGRLRLTGQNTYTGDTEVDAGELELAHSGGNALHDLSDVKLSSTASANAKLTITNSETIASLDGGGTVDIANSQTLTVKNAVNTTYSGVFTGAGNLTKGAASADTGTLTLTGNSKDYTGAISVNHGTLAIGHNNALGTTDGGTTVASGAILELRGVTIASEALSLAGTLRGHGDTENIWNGDITLTGDATLQAESEGKMNEAERKSAKLTIGGNITKNQHRLTLDATAASATRLAASIEISGRILAGTVSGTDRSLTVQSTGAGAAKGTVTFSGTGTNTYGGQTTVSAGTLRIEKNSALGATGMDNGTTVANGATLELASTGMTGLSISQNETLNLSGTLKNAAGNNTWNGAITLGAAGAAIDSAASGKTLTLSSTASITNGAFDLTFKGAGNTLVQGVIGNGSGGLIKEGAGRLKLTGASLYTGETEVKAGELELAKAGGDTIGASSAVKLASTGSAKLTITNSETIGSLSGGGEVAIARNQTLTVKNAAGVNTTYSGVFTGAGNLTKGETGDTGTLTLTGDSKDYTGAISVNHGTLAIAHNNALGTTAGGTTVSDGAILQLQGGVQVGEALTLAGGATLLSYNSENEWDGTIALTGDAILKAETASAKRKRAKLTISGNITKHEHRLTLDATAATSQRLAASIEISGRILIGTVAAGVTDNGLTVQSTGGTGGAARGTVTLSGDNTYGGQTRVNSGLLAIRHNRALGAAGRGNGTTVADGAILRLLRLAVGNIAGVNIANEALTLNGGGTLEAWHSDATWGGTITLAGNATLKADAPFLDSEASGAHLRITGNIDNNTRNLTLNATGRATRGTPTQTRAASQITISGRIGPASGTSAGGLSKEGTGKATLSGTNTYAGQTTINAGELRIEHASALPGAVELANTAGAQLTVARSATIGSLSGGGTTGGGIVIIKGQTLTVNQTTAGIYNGAITEQDPSPAITPAPTAANLSKTGAAKLTLGGDSSYTGTTTVSNGVLAITHSNALGRGAGAVTVSDGATLELAGNNLNVGKSLTLNGQGVLDSDQRQGALRNVGAGNRWSGAITLARNATITNANTGTGNTLTLGGRITGSFILTLAGAGDTEITGVIATTGDTRVEGGTLKLGRDNAINAGSKLLVSGGTFDLAGYNNTFAGVELEDGTIDDSGRLVSGETARRKGALTLSMGDYDLKNGTVNAVLAGGSGVGLEKNRIDGDNPGTVLLTAANTYGGQTTVNAGTLRIKNENALGTPASGGATNTTVNSGGTLELAGGLRTPSTETLTLNGGTLKNAAGDNTWNGAITLGAASAIDSAVSGATLTLSSTASITNSTFGLTFKGAGNTLVEGVIGSGAGGLIKEGAGRLKLTGTNTYTGETEVKAGELELARAGGDTIGASSAVKLTDAEGAKLTISENETLKSLTGGGTGENGSVSIASGKTLTINYTGSSGITYSGRVRGLGGLTKSGSGTFKLTGDNDYSGATLVSGGTLAIAHNNALGGTTSGTTVNSGATLQLQGGIRVGEALTLAGGATLLSYNSENEWDGTINLTGNATLKAETAEANRKRARLTISGNITKNEHQLTLDATGATLQRLAASIEISGRILIGTVSGTDNGLTVQSTGGADGAARGTVTLSGDNTYGGTTTVSGGTLIASHANALGTTSTDTDTRVEAGAVLSLVSAAGRLNISSRENLILNGGTLESFNSDAAWQGDITLLGDSTLRADAPFLDGATPTGTGAHLRITGNIANGGHTLTLNATGRATRTSPTQTRAASQITISGRIGPASDTSAGGLRKEGTGKATLSGTNTYAGVTWVKAGTLAIGKDNAINAGSRLIVGQLRSGTTPAVNGTFAMGTYNQTFAGVRLNSGFITATSLNGATGSRQGVLTVNARGEGVAEADGLGEFDLRSGEIQAILAGAVNVMKRSDGTTKASETPTGKAEDIGGTVRLSYTGEHLYTGTTRILAGRLLMAGGNPNSILTLDNDNLHDLAGANQRWRGVNLIHGRIEDSGKEASKTKGSLTVHSKGASDPADTRVGAYKFNLQRGEVSATLKGTGELVKRTAGLVILSANNEYSGQTQIHAGTLRIAHSGALGTPATGRDFNFKQTTVNTGGVLQLAGGASGLNLPVSQRLTLNGGTLHSLSGNNTWAGNITLRGNSTIKAESRLRPMPTPPGTSLTLSGQIDLGAYNLILEAAGAATGNVTPFPGGPSLPASRAASSITVKRPADKTGNEAIAISGAGSLTKAGTGKVTLASQNSFTGGANINAGELILQGGQALHDGGAVKLSKASGTTAQLTVEEDETIGELSGGGKIEIKKGQTLTVKQGTTSEYKGAIGEAGDAGRANLVKDGNGKLTLSGDNTYNGTTQVKDGTLALTKSGALGGGTAETGRVTVDSGATLELAASSGAQTFSNLLTLNGTGHNNDGALRHTGADSEWAGGITLAGDSVIYTAQADKALKLSGVIGQPDILPFGLTKRGPGTLTLAAVNTYTGITSVQGGTLKLGIANAISDNSRLYISGGAVFDLAGYDDTVRDVILEDGTIDDTGRRVDGTLTKGKLTVNSRAFTDDSLPHGFRLIKGTVNAVLDGRTSLLKSNRRETVFDGDEPRLRYIESTVILNAANTYSGDTTIRGGTLRITNAGALGTPAGGGATNTTIQRGGVTDNPDGSSTPFGGGTLELALGNGNRRIDNENLILAGRGAFDSEDKPIGALRNVSGNNTWSGAVKLGADNATIYNANNSSATSLTLSGNLTLTYDKENIASTVPTAANLTFTGPGKTRLSGRIRGLGGLIKQGLGTLVLNNGSREKPNDYAGGTKIKAGTLELRGGYAIPDDGAVNKGVTLSSGATLRVTDSETIGSLSDDPDDETKGGNVAIVKGQTLTVNNTEGNDTTYSGVISEVDPAGSASMAKANLTKTGAGAFTLSGANTYTGLTTVSGGALRLGASDVLHDSSSLLVNGGTFDLQTYSDTVGGVQLTGGSITATGARDSNQGKLTLESGDFDLQSGTVSAKLAGAAGLAKTGAGTVTLNSLNSYTGDTKVTAGTLALGVNDALPTSTRLTVGANTASPAAATLSLGAFNATVSNLILQSGRITGTGALKVDSAGKFDLRRGTVSAVLDGTADLEKNRVSGTIAGEVTLSGANTYTGATQINAGELILTGASDVIPDTSAVTLNNATGNTAKLTVRKDETIGSLSGGSSAGGGIDIEKGRTLTVNQTGETAYNGVIRDILPVDVSSSSLRAAFTKQGAGRLTLGGANLYTGLTTIAQGILAIANNQALGTTDTGTVVNTGATLELAPASGNLNIAGEALTLNGQGVLAGDVRQGALRNVRGNNTWGGAMTLGSNSAIGGAGSLTFGGAIDATTAGGQDLSFNGSLTLRFNGALGGTRALGNFTVDGATSLTLNANLTVTERVTLRNITAATAIDQTGGALKARELWLENYGGLTRMQSAANDIDHLLADDVGVLLYTDSDGFTVGAAPGAARRGITTRNNANISLVAGGNITIAGDIRTGSGGIAINAIRTGGRAGNINGAGVLATAGNLNLTAEGGIGTADTPLNLNFTGTAAGSLRITTSGQGAAGNIYVRNAGDLKTSVLDLNTDDASGQTARLASGGLIEVDDADGGASNLDANDTLIFNTATRLDADVNTTIRALTFAGPVTAAADRRVNTGRGALTFRATIDAGANRLTLASRRLTLTDDVTAGALHMSGAGELAIAGNTTLNVNPVNLTMPNTMTGAGALTIPGVQGQDLVLGAAPGAGLRLPANMRGYRGHLIIGGRITPEGTFPWYAPTVTRIRVNVPVLTLNPPAPGQPVIDSGGPVTLLAGDIRLNGDISAGGPLGLLAAGANAPGLTGTTGLIDASNGPVTLRVPASVRPASSSIIALNRIRGANNINLIFKGGELDAAFGNTTNVGFGVGSNFSDNTTDPDFRAFVERLGLVLGANRTLNLQFAQLFQLNPATGLVAVATLAFVDIGLFDQELTLFGAIGTGIALALAQCEEQDGCAPNITLEELDTLLEQLEARITELQRRLAEAAALDRAAIETQLSKYRIERQNFQSYRADLQKYILVEEEGFSDEGFDELPGAEADTDEIVRLSRVLESVRARVKWLESLRDNPAERARLGQATGTALTPEQLENIIEGARAQADFIENQLRLLLEGTAAGLPQAPGFRAEARGYESVDVAQYGEPPGALTLTRAPGLY